MLNNEKMISMFILNSFFWNIRNETRFFFNILHFVYMLEKWQKNPKWPPYMGLINYAI